nr:PqqD family protein [uncultured Anaerobutyricum sp.]
MKRKEGFISHTIGDKNYIVAVGDKSEQYNCVITCNGTAFYLWELLREECSEQQLVDALLEEYEVSEKQARRGVIDTLNILRKNHLLNE